MKHRLFVAIDIPSEVRAEVVKLQQTLGKLNMPVSWQEPNKLHLTLNFLGEIETDKLHEVSNIVRQTAKSFSAFSLAPAFLETLYKRHDPSLVYLGFSGDIDVLKELQSTLADAFNEFELPQAEKFLPHVKVGQLLRTDPPTTKNFLDKVSSFDFSPLSSFEVREIYIFRSFVSKAGSHFERILHFNLAETI